MRDLLEQLLAPMILLGDFNTHNPLWRSEKIRTRGRMLKKILKILRFNEKEETNYRAYNGCESTIDLTIGPEYKWSKEYKLRGSDLVSYPSFYISSNICFFRKPDHFLHFTAFSQ